MSISAALLVVVGVLLGTCVGLAALVSGYLLHCLMEHTRH